MNEQFDTKSALSFLLYLAVIIGLTYFIIHFVGQRTVVNGPSMQPTLEDGDNLIVDKFSYHFKDPKRFDIVVFPQGENTYYIKRVIGLPGERVRIDDTGIIYINDEPLKESYGKEVIRDAMDAADEITLAADEYFVLGDNRNDSMDSRDSRVGMIKRKDIIGRAWVRIFPFRNIKWM